MNAMQIEYNGKIWGTLGEFAKHIGVHPTTVSTKLNKGVSVSQIIEDSKANKRAKPQKITWTCEFKADGKVCRVTKPGKEWARLCACTVEDLRNHRYRLINSGVPSFEATSQTLAVFYKQRPR